MKIKEDELLFINGGDAWTPEGRVYFKTHSISEGEKLHRVLEVDYQRNGVSGEGFHVVKFTDARGTFIGIIFEASKTVAVVNPLDLHDHWRGDSFEPGLRAVVANWEASR